MLTMIISWRVIDFVVVSCILHYHLALEKIRYFGNTSWIFASNEVDLSRAHRGFLRIGS
jgi:hypothetical protein